jgi:transcriptional regulator with XRE-family HTH domain
MEIRELRRAAGVKACELAFVSGIHPSRLSRIERGWQQPRPDELEKIGAALAKLAAREVWGDADSDEVE